MTSASLVLRQERTVGFVLGVLSAALSYAYLQKSLFQSTAVTARAIAGDLQSPQPRYERPPPLFGSEARDKLRRGWNESIDSTLGAAVAALSSRGW